MVLLDNSKYRSINLLKGMVFSGWFLIDILMLVSVVTVVGGLWTFHPGLGVAAAGGLLVKLTDDCWNIIQQAKGAAFAAHMQAQTQAKRGKHGRGALNGESDSSGQYV